MVMRRFVRKKRSAGILLMEVAMDCREVRRCEAVLEYFQLSLYRKVSRLGICVQYV